MDNNVKTWPFWYHKQCAGTISRRWRIFFAGVHDFSSIACLVAKSDVTTVTTQIMKTNAQREIKQSSLNASKIIKLYKRASPFSEFSASLHEPHYLH
jgi:hypothetical protein